MTEVRPLRLHDLPFAYRLAGRGISFDVQLSLTSGNDDLLYALLTGTGRIQAYVLRQPGGGGLGQLHYPDSQQHARLAYIAPSLEGGASEDLWLSLLDGLTQVAGQRGAVTIIAEADEGAPETALLRRAEFVPYTRQDLWVRAPAPAEATSLSLRRADAATVPAMLGLYGALVPGLIKHVEPLPTEASDCYVLDGSRGLAALVTVYKGGQVTLAEVYLPPEMAHKAEDLLNAVLAVVQAEQDRVYLRTRDYMGCLDSALAAVGFEHVGEQIVMARHTAARVMHREFKLATKVDGGAPVPTSSLELK